MELLLRIALFAVGILHLMPATLAVLPGRIEQAYGVAVPGPNYALLLRHRAVMFGIIGGVLIAAAVYRT